jgi:CHAD domain-containing protein
MAFKVRRKRSVQKNVRRIAAQQIDQSIEQIQDVQQDRHDVVHQVRKRCKAMRGLLRLVRPEFDDFQHENSFFRDAARELSYLRDSQSIVECFDALLVRFPDQPDPQLCQSIRTQLTSRRQTIAEDTIGLDTKLNHFLALMQEARHRVDHWKINRKGFSAFEAGLRKNYRQARKASQVAFRNPSVENLHELRKRIKYLGFHVALLQNIWPEMLNVYHSSAAQLGRLLGNDHDLAVLKQTLRDNPQHFGPAEQLHALLTSIEHRRTELQQQARPLAEHLLAENPTRFSSNLRRHWDIWKACGGSPR